MTVFVDRDRDQRDYYHESEDCFGDRRGRAINRDIDLPACPECTDESATCDVVKSDGEVCGRELPCQYHS